MRTLCSLNGKKFRKPQSMEENIKTMKPDDGTQAVRRCQHCRVTKTPQWRIGPMGPKTLCNACGVRYNSGRLLPEYRPSASPTFVPYIHSNRHRKVVEMRNELVEVPVTVTQRAWSKCPRSANFYPCTSVQLTSPNPPSPENNLVDLSGSSSESEGIRESENGKKYDKLQAIEEKLKPKIPLGPIDVKKNNNGAEVKRCQQCMIAKTLHWRDGPMEPKHLCNACLVRHNSRRLFPEHRPAASSTFPHNLNSYSHRNVIKTRIKLPQPATFSPRVSTQLISPNPPSHENHLTVLSGSSSESECVKESDNGKNCHEPQAVEEKTLTPKISLGSIDEQKNNNGTQAVKICHHCAITNTTLWRNGPMGPRTLCNACGVRYRSGRLLPKYRPAASPTFVPSLHSNSHREVIEIRNKLVEEKSVDVTKHARSKRPRPATFSPRTSIQLTSPNPPSHKNHLTVLFGSSSEFECVKESENGKKCHEAQAIEEKTLTLKILFGSMNEQKNNNGTQTVKVCQHCAITKTTLWRNGPMGPKTLCNACGVRYRSGRLLPEYCPAAIPTFVPSLHSNSHREVIEIRNKLVEEKSVDVTEHARTKRPRPATFSPRTSSQLTSPNPSCHKNHLTALSGDSLESEVVKESENGKKCHEPQAIEEKMTTPKIPLGPNPMDEPKNKNGTQADKICQHCAITTTTLWRNGPMGPKTLCNACGVRYRSGRLLPEYRPAASPTFVPSLHSNSHREVIEIRNKLVEEKFVDVAARVFIPDIGQPSVNDI